VVSTSARLRGIAHGGQVLVSAITRDLARAALSDQVELRDLGQHRLQGLSEPEHVFQAVHPKLPKDFSPLLSLDAHVHNLPVEVTRLIGRRDEVAAVERRLLDPDVRLVTLTGIGGTGKTRVALQVAAELIDRFRNGVTLVSLAALRNPALVLTEVARALGVQQRTGETVLASLQSFSSDKEMLLVLDNFEQVLPAAADLSKLLATAVGLKLLVTSRVRLRLYGEQEMPLQPLRVPTPHSLEQAIGDHSRRVLTTNVLAGVLAEQGDYPAARARLAEAQVMCRELGDKNALTIALTREGFIACVQGDLAGADRLCDAGMRWSPETVAGEPRSVGHAWTWHWYGSTRRTIARRPACATSAWA
jgi:hypothetical protein